MNKRQEKVLQLVLRAAFAVNGPVAMRQQGISAHCSAWSDPHPTEGLFLPDDAAWVSLSILQDLLKIY